MFFLVIRNSSSKRCIGGAALINFFVPNAALIRGRRLIEGGAYSSKYGTCVISESKPLNTQRFTQVKILTTLYH